MLRRLLSARGANASLVTVFIDGFFQQPVDVAKLFGIRAVQVSVCVALPPVWCVWPRPQSHPPSSA